jgi:hypothetical protein
MEISPPPGRGRGQGWGLKPGFSNSFSVMPVLRNARLALEPVERFRSLELAPPLRTLGVAAGPFVLVPLDLHCGGMVSGQRRGGYDDSHLVGAP